MSKPKNFAIIRSRGYFEIKPLSDVAKRLLEHWHPSGGPVSYEARHDATIAVQILEHVVTLLKGGKENVICEESCDG